MLLLLAVTSALLMHLTPVERGGTPAAASATMTCDRISAIISNSAYPAQRLTILDSRHFKNYCLKKWATSKKKML